MKSKNNDGNKCDVNMREDVIYIIKNDSLKYCICLPHC